MDAFEKRLEAGEKDTRDWLVKHSLNNFSALNHANDIQKDKVVASRFQKGFFGKSNQGSFEIDEEKPYKHEFRDWKRLPVFYN
jgi:hypothetical protein